MNRARVIVVKIGGSLLTSAKLPQRLRSWLAAEADVRSDAHFVLVVGGGKWVDAIREINVHAPLGEERAHWICVEIMDVTAGLVGAMLPEISVISTFSELERRVARPGITILRPRQFVEEVEPLRVGTKLARDWSVTSDAIAGRLAVVLRAEQLVLLKFVAAPTLNAGRDWLAQLSAAGYVDAFMPKLSNELGTVRCQAI